MNKLIGYIFSILITAGLVVLQGWIFQICWNFSIVPYFHLLPMGLWQAVIFAVMTQLFFKPKIDIKGQ